MKNSQSGFASIILLFIVVVIAGAGGLYYVHQKAKAPKPEAVVTKGDLPPLKEDISKDTQAASTTKNFNCGVETYDISTVGIKGNKFSCFMQHAVDSCSASMVVNNPKTGKVYFSLDTISSTNKKCNIVFTFIDAPRMVSDGPHSVSLANVSGKSMTCSLPTKQEFNEALNFVNGSVDDAAIIYFSSLILNISDDPHVFFDKGRECTGSAVVAAEAQWKTATANKSIVTSQKISQLQNSGIPIGFKNAQDSARLKAAWTHKSLLRTYSPFEQQLVSIKSMCWDFNNITDGLVYELGTDGKKKLWEGKGIKLEEYINTDSPGIDPGDYVLTLLGSGTSEQASFENVLTGTETRFTDRSGTVFEIKPSGYCKNNL